MCLLACVQCVWVGFIAESWVWHCGAVLLHWRSCDLGNVPGHLGPLNCFHGRDIDGLGQLKEAQHMVELCALLGRTVKGVFDIYAVEAVWF